MIGEEGGGDLAAVMDSHLQLPFVCSTSHYYQGQDDQEIFKVGEWQTFKGLNSHNY